MRFAASTAILVCLFTASARAQVLYQTQFDDDAGWVMDAPNPQGTQWKVDNRPGTTPLGPYHSEPASLNYNNDVDYAGFHRGASAGTKCVSPVVQLAQSVGVPTLVFWCNNKLEELLCDNHESVTVRVYQGSVLKVKFCLTCATCYQNAGTISPCNFAAWHEHVIPLDAAWGDVTIQFWFRGDGIANSTAGMFIDDLMVVDLLPTTAYCVGKLNSQGCVATVSTVGAPDLTSGLPFTIQATQALNQKNGVFFYGVSGRFSAPFLGGTMCVRSPIRRTSIQSSGGNALPDDCSGSFDFDFNAWAQSGVDPALTAGTAVDGQFWYRDAADPYRTGLSNAIEFAMLP